MILCNHVKLRDGTWHEQEEFDDARGAWVRDHQPSGSCLKHEKFPVCENIKKCTENIVV